MINYSKFNTTSDHAYNLFNAITYCREAGEYGIIFDRGRYDFYPDKAAEQLIHVSNHDIYGEKRIAFLINNMKDFTIDGCGSEFIFHSDKIPFALIESSNITVNIGFALAGVDNLRGIGQDTTTDFLTQLDDMLATVNAKQVEYGSAQNRLESALDEISTQYENLVSSRSTLRDADIAEVSAEYIQQQILQQAAATLMSTANQSPAIALQLI